MEAKAETVIPGLRSTARELERKGLPSGHVIIESFKAIESALNVLAPRSRELRFRAHLQNLVSRKGIPRRLCFDIMRLKDLRNSAAHDGPTLQSHDALFARATLLEFVSWLEEQVPLGTPRQRQGNAAALQQFIARKPGTCDDCISDQTGIKPRQTVNQSLRGLQKRMLVERREGSCLSCGREKIVTVPSETLKA